MTKYFTDYQYPSMNILELKMTKYFIDYQYPSMNTLELQMTKYFTDYQYLNSQYENTEVKDDQIFH